MRWLSTATAVAVAGVLLAVVPLASAVPPGVSIDATPANPTTATTATFSFSSPDVTATFDCDLDGTSVPCTTPTVYSGLADGSHTFTVLATNADSDTSTASFTWTVDSTPPPPPTISTGPSGATNDVTPNFTFSSAGATTFNCAIDDPTPTTPCNGGTFTATTLTDGAHTFYVTAADGLGNTSVAATRAFTVDTAPPPLPTISTGPSGPTNDATPNFTFSSAGATTFKCAVDDPTPNTACNGGTFTATTLTDGAHTFYVTATDAAGNTSAAANQAFTVDSTPPPPPTISTGPSGATNDVTPNFTFSSAGATTFNCAIDDPTPTTPCNGGTFTATTLTDGAHTFYVTAADGLGNTSVAATRAFTVDTAPPPLPTISTGPSGPTNDATPNFTFSSAGATTFKCAVDDPTPNTACNGGTFTATTLTDGAHTFYVTAANALGTTSAAASQAFTVDTAAPSTTISPAVPAASATAAVTITFGSTDGTATFACNLDSGGFNSCTSPVSLVALADGLHTVSIKATDAAGNVDPTPATATWTVDTTAPVLTGPGNLTVEADSPSGTKVAFSVSGSDAGLALLPGAIVCAPLSNTRFLLGKTTVTCTASDALGNIGMLSFDVTVRDTTAPSINAPDVSFTAIDASGIARTDPAVASYLAGISASDLISGTTVTTTTPEKLPIGITKIVVTARDAAGNESQKNVTLTVLEPGKKAPPPDFTPPGSVRNAKATAGDGKVVLTWVRPIAADLRSIRIVRTVVGSTAGTTVFAGLAKTFTNRGLENGVAYRYEFVAFDKAGNSSQSVVVTATPVALLLASPRPGAKVTKPPVLRWAKVRSAPYFNVQLYRSGKKVLSAWPAVARLPLKSRWAYDKRSYTLKPGVYTWYVWPGVGPRSAAVYGTLLGKSSFTVTPARV